MSRLTVVNGEFVRLNADESEIAAIGDGAETLRNVVRRLAAYEDVGTVEDFAAYRALGTVEEVAGKITELGWNKTLVSGWEEISANQKATIWTLTKEKNRLASRVEKLASLKNTAKRRAKRRTQANKKLREQLDAYRAIGTADGYVDALKDSLYEHNRAKQTEAERDEARREADEMREQVRAMAGLVAAHTHNETPECVTTSDGGVFIQYSAEARKEGGR